MWSLPGRLISGFLLSVSLLSVISTPIHALSPGSHERIEPVIDETTKTLAICVKANFTDYESPRDDQYDAIAFYNVTSTPVVLNFVSAFVIDGTLTHDEFCVSPNTDGEVWSTEQKFRFCATKQSDVGSDLICNEDQSVTMPPQPEPETPVDPGTGSSEYPSYGFMVGTQVTLVFGFLIAHMLVKQYSPRSRR